MISREGDELFAVRPVEYRMAWGYDWTNLESAVNDYLKQGFEPHGNPVLTPDVGSVLWAQAMVRYVRVGMVKAEEEL